MIENAGHMLHHDQPEILAEIIEDFLAGPGRAQADTPAYNHDSR
jgi:carboxypeptidase C (cathepsin A)